MKLTLKIWRQKSPADSGAMETHVVDDVSTDMSFLELLDVLNERLQLEGKDPVAFDHDCREGICGMCSLVINGKAHGPWDATTACQLHMRAFKDGDEILIEPFRAGAFGVIKDLVVDRSALDRVIQSGGFVSVNTGGAPDANAVPIGKHEADRAMDAAACIGCGACVAACPNASAMLFVSAKIGHLGHLPQGQPERDRRVSAMVESMDNEGFGSCRNYQECSAVCPKEIPIDLIGELNRDWRRCLVKGA
ncbi:MAG: succinate dehydrogenase/fumarate reductase iron-sulfur subunit [Planctomycetota bacterium]|nr:MAG: succinate dehydrogenase/fumarate reductase iron-sulfur subunit [Planctomycetota bacterium]